MHEYHVIRHSDKATHTAADLDEAEEFGNQDLSAGANIQEREVPENPLTQHLLTGRGWYRESPMSGWVPTPTF